MAHDEPQAAGPTKLVIRNIGLLLSGDIDKPVLDADTIVADNGKISAIGRAKDVDTAGATTVIDANGTTVTPGLIDSHVHPVAGDWTPRQNQIGWIDSFLNGGVTTMISAGEVHMPGRPRDVVGVKAMAIFAQRAFHNFRPGGVKVHAGAPVIEPGMTEEDFKELATAGVKLLGEVGLGGVKDGPTARKMVAWARKYGIQSTIHTGGPSIPGSGLIDADVVLEADTDVVGRSAKAFSTTKWPGSPWLPSMKLRSSSNCLVSVSSAGLPQIMTRSFSASRSARPTSLNSLPEDIRSVMRPRLWKGSRVTVG